jgi:integrase
MPRSDRRIHRLPDGRNGNARWQARWWGTDGKQAKKTFPSHGEAVAYLEGIDATKRRGTYVNPNRGRVKLADYFEKWIGGDPLADPPRRPAPLEPSTRRLYRGMFAKHFAPIGSHQLAKITRRAVKDWVGGLEAGGVQPRTIGVCHALLRRLLSVAIDDEILTTNVAARVELPRAEHQEMRALEAAEVARLADAVGGRDRVLIHLLAYGGPRVGEALALRVKDLHLPDAVDVEVGDAGLARGTVRIERALKDVGGRLELGPTKTKQGRTVSLPRFLVDELRTHIGDSDDKSSYSNVEHAEEALVFSAPGGGPIRLNNWRRRVFQPAACTAGLGKMVKGPNGKERYEGVRVHDLRHTCASLLIAKGADIVEIAKRLGHSSPTTTQTIYAKLLESRDVQLAAALDETFTASVPTPATVVELGGGA